jgi:antitoxin (DNA-binding transcriptional repressor) of toxin-antitoxin stability system
MERAAAGEAFMITRRGRPYARLTSPYEQLTEPPDEDERPKLEIFS